MTDPPTIANHSTGEVVDAGRKARRHVRATAELKMWGDAQKAIRDWFVANFPEGTFYFDGAQVTVYASSETALDLEQVREWLDTAELTRDDLMLLAKAASGFAAKTLPDHLRQPLEDMTTERPRAPTMRSSPRPRQYREVDDA